LDAHNVRRAFRKVVDSAGLVGKSGDPASCATASCPLLSDDGMPIEQISRLVEHTNTTVTETVYRLQIRPVLTERAKAMDRIFSSAD
jgi:hypothetical protein